MLDSDLDWIVETEASLHPSPWSAVGFRDSMAAGHACWTFWEGVERAAYAVLLLVLDEAHLLNITVAPARQGRGVGAAALGFLLDQARQNGASQFFLEVRESNLQALSLYRSRGFKAIGRRKGYYPGAPVREDAIVMRFML